VEPSAAVSITAGASSEARFVILVADGFHLQANPASEKYLVATELEMAKTSEVWPGRPVYPPGRPYRLRGASSDLTTYEGRFEIRLPITASAKAKPGAGALTGKLHYQACDAKTCLFPSSVPVELKVTVVASKSSSR
jgi:hypothetical protein